MTASPTTTPVELTTAPATESVSLTETAAVKVRALLDQEGRDDLRLRVAVQPGGCSGLQYQLFFDERSLDGDLELDLQRRAAGRRPDERARTSAAPRSTSPTRSSSRASRSTTRTPAAAAPAATRFCG